MSNNFCLGSRKSGATFRNILRAVLRASECRDKKVIFIIGRDQQECVRHSVIAKTILASVSGCNVESRTEILMPNGNLIMFKSIDWYRQYVAHNRDHSVAMIKGYGAIEGADIFIDHFAIGAR